MLNRDRIKSELLRRGMTLGMWAALERIGSPLVPNDPRRAEEGRPVV